MANRIIIKDGQWRYYKVKLTETVASVVFEGWIRHIWAHDKKEAATKALVFHMRRNKGSEPHLAAVELEDYDEPIRI